MTDENGGGGTDPERAFALLGNDTRAAIMEVLGETPHEGLSFSELRERVDRDVDSGQFNYHLQQLVGEFVEHADAGYTLSPRGLAIYRAIRSGSITGGAAVEPFDVGVDCYFCGGPVRASYREGSFNVRCSDCGHVYANTAVPPATVEDVDPDELLERVDQYTRHELLAYSRGVCPVCVNDLDPSFVPGEEVWSTGAEHLEVFVAHECDNCGQRHFMSVGLALLYHPAVVSFFHDRGVDVTRRPTWELAWAMTDETLTVRSRDPWEVVLGVPCGDDVLELVVEESLTVTDTSIR